MTKDKNLAVFLGKPQWYTFEKGVGYVAKEDAPEEVKQAIAKYNSYGFKKK